MNAMSLCFSWQQNIETLNSKLKKKKTIQKKKQLSAEMKPRQWKIFKHA